MADYPLGISIAILSGIVANIGLLLQKKVVNEKRGATGEQYAKGLIKNKVWLLGTILNFLIGSLLLSMVARDAIGPALVPGLQASGLIVLAIGSVKIIGEKLEKIEWIGIILIIVAIVVFGFSGMVIEINTYDWFSAEFLNRYIGGSLVLFGIAAVLWLSKKKVGVKTRAFSFALISGIFLALSELWVTPIVAFIDIVFGGQPSSEMVVFFTLGSIIVVCCDFLAIAALQIAFKNHQASNLVPVQQVPLQIMPLIAFLAIYACQLPGNPCGMPLTIDLVIVIVLFLVGASLILGGFVILSRRKVLIEEIELEKKTD